MSTNFDALKFHFNGVKHGIRRLGKRNSLPLTSEAINSSRVSQPEHVYYFSMCRSYAPGRVLPREFDIVYVRHTSLPPVHLRDAILACRLFLLI